MKEERRNLLCTCLIRLHNHVLVHEKGFDSTWIAWIDFGVVRINFVANRNDFKRKPNQL